ncbi:Crp/Fnr family transcriptional regulator [Variovorax sp. LT1P1]
MNPELNLSNHPSARRPKDRLRVNVLEELSESAALALTRIGVKRLYHDKQIVQQRGGSAEHALICVSGRLRAVLYTADGTEQLFRWMEPGEISGVSTVLGEAPLPIDLVAEGATVVLMLPRQPLLELLSRDAEVCLLVARVLSLRVNELLDVMATRANDTLGARVWATLQRLARENGKPLEESGIKLWISQSDLAHSVGASRQRVSDELRLLQSVGKVRLGYRWLEVIDQTPAIR